MQSDEEVLEKPIAITHSPYYGCTVRVISKVHVAYEGILDGISPSKDRIYLKNVRVNANPTGSSARASNGQGFEQNDTSDALNALMIEHLTNDIRQYEQVCLSVRDIEELRLIEMPATFHESKAKLRAIDPCLVDIRLSPSDEYETQSTSSNSEYSRCTPISRQKRGDSIANDGRTALISSSSNDSSASSGYQSNEKFTTEESNDESIEETLENIRQLNLGNIPPRAPTLLAKKVLPKRNQSSETPNPGHRRLVFSEQRDATQGPAGFRLQNQQHISRQIPTGHQNDRAPPIRVTIASKLNPNAVPFYAQAKLNTATNVSSFTFYERPRFRPRLPTVISPDRSQSFPVGINTFPNQQIPSVHLHSQQRFVPPRQLMMKKPISAANSTKTNRRPVQTPIPMAKYRIQPSASSDKRSYSHQQQPSPRKSKQNETRTSTNLARQISLPTTKQLLSPNGTQRNFLLPIDNSRRQSNSSLYSTSSLPYQHVNARDRHLVSTPTSFGEPIGSHRSQRTFSGASSCSSLSLDIGPHSIVQFDSPSAPFITSDDHYDFEKANEEFRRYLELEELVTRRNSSHRSTNEHSDVETGPEALTKKNSYKKEVSFFDRISCTATTGTAVAYTEMDETEKNFETFGDDALIIGSISTDDD